MPTTADAKIAGKKVNEMEELTEMSKMPFGKYRGYKMKDVPAPYLDYLSKDIRDGNVKRYIERNRAAIDEQLRRLAEEELESF